MTETQTSEIVNALKSLPSEKVTEVQDFVMFLRERYGKMTVDESDEWTDEDLSDALDASLKYLDEETEL